MGSALVVAVTPVASAHTVKSTKTSCSTTSAQNSTSAVMLAKTCHKPVAITADQTPYTQISANANGTTTYTSSATPRWVEQDGAWVGVNASLVANKDGSFSPKAAESGLKFSGGGDTALATASTSQGSMTVSWPSKLPVPTVKDASATYADVLPGVNLVVTADVTGGFEESLIVESAAAAKDPGLSKLVLGMSTSKGMSASADKSGRITVKDAKGKAVFSSAPPRAWDSSKDAKPVSVPVSFSGGKATLGPPAALLSSAGTVFPVTIDPSYTVAMAWQGYGEDQSAYPSNAELDATYNGQVSVGYFGGGIDRGYYVFGLPSGAVGATVQVLSATVGLTATSATSSSSQAHSLDAYYTSQYSSTSTWNNPPTNTAGPTAVNYTTTSTTPNQAVSINVASWVQTALQDDAFQFSLGLINTNETTSAGAVAFAGAATLSITYDNPPGSLANLALSPENWATDGHLYTSSSTPTFQASATDPDGDTIAYEFKVTQGSSVIEDATSGYFASGATGSLASSVTLTNHTTYQLTVRPYDGTEYGVWSSALSFTPDSVAPPVPTISCSGYPSGTWSALVSGGTTCSVTDASSYVSSYVYEYIEGSNYNNPTWGWVSGASASISIDPPSDGLYYLVITAYGDGGLETYAPWYSFGVGADGAMLSPTDGSQTASAVTLQAAVPGSYTQATFKYRIGTTGSFTTIPNHVVYQCNCPVTFPVSTTANNAGVQTNALTWYLNRTIADDGLVQVEAVFNDASGNTMTTPPVSVSLSRIGAGAGFGTTTAGPVTVGLQSGNAALSASDVNVSAYDATLAVSRTFNSVNPTASGIFGPGWVSSVGSTQASSWSSIQDDSSYVVLTAGNGATFTFTTGATSGSTVSYTADASAAADGLILTKNTTSDAFALADSNNDVTSFPYSSANADYLPSTITSPGTTSSTGIVYNSSGNPLLVVAPDAASSSAPTTACPSPVSSSTWTSAGCRGLSFTYDTSGDVSEIDFVYVDNGGTFHDTAVAKYGYDSSGRLTSEYDPRLSTPLVTGYTYDETSTDADYGRITAYSPAQAASSGAIAPWHFTYDDTATDVNYGKILTVVRTHSSTYGGTTATDTIDYTVPLTVSAGGPINMDATTAATWAESNVPTSAVAIWPGGYTPTSTTSPTATDYENSTLDYFDASGRLVNTASYVNGAWAVATTQYDSNGSVLSTLSAANRATALASSSTQAEAEALSAVNVYACDDFGTIDPACDENDADYRVETASYGPAHSVNVDGVLETERDETAYGFDAGAPNSDATSSGLPYMLQTSVTTEASIGSAIPGSSNADARTVEDLYTVGGDATGWSLGSPLETVTDPAGLDVVATTGYNENSALYNGDNLIIDQDQPADSSGGTAGDTHTVYYTAGTNSQVAACGNKPEWANLVCETYPAAQPADTSTIPTKTYTYTDYLSVATETDTYGSAGTKVTTNTYDAAGRTTGVAITVSGTGMGTAPAATATVYDTDSGLVVGTETLTSTGAAATEISAGYDDFGQELTYTDASGAETSYTYNLDGATVSKTTPEDTSTITYSAGGQAVSETDSLAGTFTATYNPDGTLATETYPDGTLATYTIDPTATATALTYTNSNWASPIADSVTLNSQGDWVGESTLSDTKSYVYDNDDRLTSVQDTYAGLCTTRSYTYDLDSNRTQQTVYDAATGGACQATTATDTENYSYDTADRLESSTLNGTTGTYAYDVEGDITDTPSADAGGTGDLTAAYYANGLLDTQSQAGDTDSYTLDGTLARYSSETDSTSAVTTTDHYSDGGDSPAWTSSSAGGWTADVTDLDGTLGAEATSTGTVTLELADLHGDVMATVNPSADSAPQATYVYTEFGSPEAGSDTPGTYGYLGVDQRSEASMGATVLMGVRVFNRNTGRFDSPDPVFGGSANAYDYEDQNPLATNDLGGTTLKERNQSQCNGVSCVSIRRVCDSTQNMRCSLNWYLSFEHQYTWAWVTDLVWYFYDNGVGVSGSVYSHDEYGGYLFHGSWYSNNSSRGRGWFRCFIWSCYLDPSDTISFWTYGTFELYGVLYDYVTEDTFGGGGHYS